MVCPSLDVSIEYPFSDWPHAVQQGVACVAADRVKTKPGPPPPLSWPFNCFVENNKNNELKLQCTQYVCYKPPLLSQSTLLRFGFQLEWRQSRSTFPSLCSGISEGNQELFGDQQLEQFPQTCHCQVAWTPAIAFRDVLRSLPPHIYMLVGRHQL